MTQVINHVLRRNVPGWLSILCLAAICGAVPFFLKILAQFVFSATELTGVPTPEQFRVLEQWMDVSLPASTVPVQWHYSHWQDSSADVTLEMPAKDFESWKESLDFSFCGETNSLWEANDVSWWGKILPGESLCFERLNDEGAVTRIFSMPGNGDVMLVFVSYFET